MERASLGKLIAVHTVAPTHQQRAAVVAGLAFLFFLAMMTAFYLRGQFGYFLLATAFIVVFLFTLIGLWAQRRNVVEVFDRGIVFKKFTAAWQEIVAVENEPGGPIKLTRTDGSSATIPRSIDSSSSLAAYLRKRCEQPSSL